MVDGRAKGQDFEREAARKISLWISDNKDKDLLWRSAGSGGRAASGHGIEYGDLSVHKFDPIAVEFIKNFCVELKRWKEVNPAKMMYNPHDDLLKEWLKNYRVADKFNVNPLLIVKVDFVEPFWLFDGGMGMPLARRLNLPYFMVENSMAMVCGVCQRDLFQWTWHAVRNELSLLGVYNT